MKKNKGWHEISFILLFATISVVYYVWPKLNESAHRPICSNSCKASEVCMNTSLLGTSLLVERCLPIPQKTPLHNIKLPFGKGSSVFCTHASGVGTHAWPNAYWAIDLATPYDEKNATIYAALDGVAYVSQEHCREPNGTAASADVSDCGQGFGNWVKVYHGHGYYTFYAHLDRVLVKNGQSVKQGEPIGVEGWTGNAGHRHLHWSVQKLPGKTEKERLKHILIYIGESVPFDFWALGSNRSLNKFSIIDLDCVHSNITAATQPRFEGAL